MSSTTSSSTPKRVDLVRTAPTPVNDSVSATALRTHRAGALTRAHVGQQVRLGGWVHRRRDLGGLVFIDLRDRAGLVQLSCNPDWTPAGGDGARRGRGRRDRRAGHRAGGAPARAVARSGPGLARGRGARHRPRDRRTGPDAGHSGSAEGEGGARRRGAPPQAPRARPAAARAAAEPAPPAPAPAARTSGPRPTSDSSRSRRRSSRSRRPKARATISCRAGCTRASSTPCRSRPRSTSSC